MALVGPIFALLLGVSAACGGSDTGDDVASASGGGARPSASGSAAADPDQSRKFAQCVRDNGVPDFPDPGPDGQFDFEQLRGQNMDQEQLRKATEACRDVAPNGGRPGQADAAQQEQLRKFAQCMRDNGVDMADPDPNGGGFGGQGGQPPFDQNDPKVQKALESCRGELTSVQGGGGG
ncbi:hypothetical protein [Virgisporangium aurantiacum]|nr:hypothetical protein [Virgisporangium aurantiacum]